MPKLSGWTYLITGLIISIASYFINKKTGESKLFLFFIIGIIFIVIGFFKIFRRKKEKQTKKSSKVLFCRYCGQAIYETYEYCPRCRSKLR